MSYSEEHSKRTSVRRTLADLPPRVVIFDILSFHMFVIYGYLRGDRDDFSLFGYFKRDRRRNAWFLFTSINIGSTLIEDLPEDFDFERVIWEKCFIDFKKLEYLSIRVSYESLFGRLKKEADGMFRLSHLEITGLDNYRQSGIFTSPICFPKLRTVRIYSSEGLDWEAFWTGTDRPLCDITEFGLFKGILEPMSKTSVFNTHTSNFEQNLKRLSLHRIVFVEKVILQFSNLKVLDLHHIGNLEVITSTLISLQLSSTFVTSVEISLRRSLSLEKIAVLNPDELILTIFNLKNNPMKMLRQIHLKDVLHVITDDESTNTWKVICAQLDELKLENCQELYDIFLNIHSTNIRKLDISGVEIHHDNYEIQSSQVTESCLNIEDLDIDCQIYESFFEENNWEKLEFLQLRSLMNLGNIALEDKLQNLRTIKLEDVDKPDNFFVYYDFPSLEIVIFDSCTFEGKNWNTDSQEKFGSLKYISARRCCLDGAILCEKIPSLETLQLFNCNGIAQTWVIRDCEVIMSWNQLEEERMRSLEKENKIVFRRTFVYSTIQ